MAKKTLLAEVLTGFFENEYVAGVYGIRVSDHTAALAKALAAKARLHKKPDASYKTAGKSHTKRILLEFSVENDPDKARVIEVFDNDIAVFFERIIRGSRVQSETKALLFCHCFARHLEENAQMLEAFKGAMRAKELLPSTRVEADIYRCYHDGEVNEATPQRVATKRTNDFASQLWDRDKLSTWRFYAGFKQREKATSKRGFSDKDRIAKTILGEAKKHPVFEMLLESDEKALHYKDEILSMLKLCTVYDAKLAKPNNPYLGIVVLSPLNAFYTRFKAEVRSYFRYSLGQYNVYSLGLVAGAFAARAEDGKHTFGLYKDDLGLEGDSEYYIDARDDFDAIVTDIEKGKIKCIHKVGKNEYAFIVSQHRYYFQAYYDYIRYCAKQLTVGDLTDIIIKKALKSVEEKSSHLDRKYTELICYAFFLLSFLGPGCKDVLDELCKYANNFSVQDDIRHKQTAVLQLFSCLMAESFPVTRTYAKTLLELSYGRAAYPYQLVVLRGFEDVAPQYFRFLQECVVKSLELDANGKYVRSEPKGILIASKLNIKKYIKDTIIEPERYGGRDALDFFCECARIHDVTWPDDEISYEDEVRIITLLQELKVRLGDHIDKSTTPAPAYVYGGNLLLFSLANVIRGKKQEELSVFTHLFDKSNYFESIIYIDYFTRKLSYAYNNDEAQQNFYLLCGGFRMVCAWHFKRTVIIKGKGTMLADYERWIKKEIATGVRKGAQRYWLLLTRLLSYTDFFSKHPDYVPTFEDCVGTQMLDYDNIPSVTQENKALFDTFIKAPRALLPPEASKPNIKN